MAFIKMLLKRVVTLLIFYQLCRILFYAFNYQYFNLLSLQDLPLLFWGSLRFDLSAILYLNTVYILLFILPFPARYNKKYQAVGKGIFIVSNSVGILANLADCAYYPFIMRRTNASFFLEFRNDTNLIFETGKFIISYWLIAFIGILFVYLLIKSYNWIQMPEKAAHNNRQWAVNLTLLPVVFIVWLGFARGSFVPSNRPINMSYAGDYVNNPNEVNLVINTPFSIMMTWGNIKVAEVNYYEDLDKAALHYTPIQVYPNDTSPAKKNVVIIIVESLSREFIGSLNNEKETYRGYTPFLDTLISKSLAFKYAFANGKRSIEALPSVVASIPSHTEAFVLTPYSFNKTNSIGSVLKKQGYHTSFFHGAHEGSMGFSAFMKIAGFENSYSKKEYGNDAHFDGTWGIWDEEFMQYWAQQLNTFPQPFCSALFTVSSHHPFELPSRYKNSFEKGDLHIHRSIQYTDQSLKKFFESAEKTSWYKNTVFIITADHAATYAYYEDYQTSIGAYAIPIVFFTPDSSLHGFRNDLIQQGDIFPTLLDYIGISDTIAAFGTSVLHSSDGNLVVNYYSGIYQAFYGDYLLQFDGRKNTALYRFKQDERLQYNILHEQPEQAELIEKKLKAYIQQYATRVRENKMIP